MSHTTIECFGYASDQGGARRGAALSPKTIQNSNYLKEIIQHLHLHWHPFHPIESSQDKFTTIKKLCKELGTSIEKVVQEKKFFTVFGGDHSSAIATWGGASVLGEIGLIWVDAHMDSHTPETTMTGNIHGMPLATLLGHGNPELTNLFGRFPILKAENVCLIGVRSFESGEAKLLQDLNVKIYYMEEVKKRGMQAVMQDAIHYISQKTSLYGASIDVDSIDPTEAPGTGVPEPDGISGEDLCESLKLLANDPKLIGIEIVEFDPSLDENHKTEKLVARIFSAITLGK